MEETRETRPRKRYGADGKDLLAALGLILCALALVNVIFFGGFHLGFALVGIGYMVVCCLYLWRSGRKPTPYSAALLILSAILVAGFARSDDDFVKFVILCLLFITVNLALCLQAGQQRRDPGGFSTLADPFRTAFGYGFSKWGRAIGGLGTALRESGSAGGKVGAVALGLLIAVPILAIVLPLLISSDAAFAGVVDLLPEIQVWQIFVTALFGALLACFFLSHILSLRHLTPKEKVEKQRKGVNSLTINTILIMVCLVYLVYLLSQLAYFVGGFSGILPENYTMAEYARRGFFEMFALCAINLLMIALMVGIVAKNPKVPLLTRLLCMFVGVVTLFFVASASAKMGMYIQSYGLTRLRLLTEVVMVFLGLVTALICVWLFVPKIPYMKVVLLTALVFGAVVLWGDVDTVVAHYNVTAYQQGILETVDVSYLRGLNSSTIPYLEELTHDSDPKVAEEAARTMDMCAVRGYDWDDLRDWNWADHVAQQILEAWSTVTDNDP